MDHHTNQMDRVRYFGQQKQIDDCLFLCQSGSGFEMTGCISQAQILVYSPDCENSRQFPAYLGVFVDGEETHSRKIQIAPGEQRITLFHADQPRPVTIRVVKLTEAQYGQVGLKGLYADGALEHTTAQSRKLLFIGDSITAGYGVICSTPDEEFTTSSEDVTCDYSWLTARALQAEVQITAMSGCGLTTRWIPPEEEEPLTDILMGRYVNYLDWHLDTTLGLEPTPLEAEAFQPDVICINLGTNDASYTRGLADRESAFRQAYTDLLLHLQQRYPQAHLLCIYGAMEKTLLPSVQSVVSVCKEKNLQVSLLELQPDETADGVGIAMHPSANAHIRFQKQVTQAICAITGWNPD